MSPTATTWVGTYVRTQVNRQCSVPCSMALARAARHELVERWSVDTVDVGGLLFLLRHAFGGGAIGSFHCLGARLARFGPKQQSPATARARVGGSSLLCLFICLCLPRLHLTAQTKPTTLGAVAGLASLAKRPPRMPPRPLLQHAAPRPNHIQPVFRALT